MMMMWMMISRYSSGEFSVVVAFVQEELGGGDGRATMRCQVARWDW